VRRPRRPAQELRIAIDCLPERTRLAMLEGIRTNRIIVGAYTDQRGGVCPMLAAHRCGGRTNLASFAKAWDRYTAAGHRPRPASERELGTLRTMLEASLAEDGYLQVSLADEVSRVKAERRKRAERAATGTSQGWISQLLGPSKTVPDATADAEDRADRRPLEHVQLQ
jgi:hypothetical protein